jgi:hypothetical protein
MSFFFVRLDSRVNDVVSRRREIGGDHSPDPVRELLGVWNRG